MAFGPLPRELLFKLGERGGPPLLVTGVDVVVVELGFVVGGVGVVACGFAVCVDEWGVEFLFLPILPLPLLFLPPPSPIRLVKLPRNLMLLPTPLMIPVLSVEALHVAELPAVVGLHGVEG